MKRGEIIFTLTSGFILVVAWIVFNLYHASASSSISETLNTQTLPITPNFDMTTVDRIKNRSKIQPVYQLQTSQASSSSQSGSLSTTPTPVSVPVLATPFATPAVATSGGVLTQ